jgi:hypothetical protein
MSRTDGKRQFEAVPLRLAGGSIFVAVPFDPDAVWGKRRRHHVTGFVGHCKVRGPLSVHAGRHGLKLGPAWVRDNPLKEGGTVAVTLSPEGPQRQALDDDIAAALKAEPDAASFFDGLAQFYRKAWLTWIAGTRKRPEERARRIAEMVRLLKAGVKQRPK